MICRHHFLMTLRFTLFLLMYLAGCATAAQVLSRTIGCGFGHLGHRNLTIGSHRKCLSSCFFLTLNYMGTHDQNLS